MLQDTVLNHPEILTWSESELFVSIDRVHRHGMSLTELLWGLRG